MPKYFSQTAFVEQYKKLRHTQSEGQTGMIGSSAILRLLAIDLVQKAESRRIVDLAVGADRDKFLDAYVTLVSVPPIAGGQQNANQHRIEDLGYISPSSSRETRNKINSNFVTSTVNQAAGRPPTDWPKPGARQEGHPVLTLGLGRGHGVQKVDEWQKELNYYASARHLESYNRGLDFTPFIMLLLKDSSFPDDVTTDKRGAVKAALESKFTTELTRFLLKSTDFDAWPDNYFADASTWEGFPFEELLKESGPDEEKDKEKDAGSDDSRASESQYPRNRIIYGAPGTGKSNKLKTESTGFEETRVMFHPDYTYSQFVGGYRPSTLYRTPADGVEIFDGSGRKIDRQLEPVIDYALASGPFLDVLVKALNDPSKNYLLLIEEINRANVAAVFGDVFQLLDRNDAGFSEYDVTPNREIGAFLKEAVKNFSGKMQLPDNMYIWATMNSADQGVFPMDSAFKRRWSFEYLPLNQPKQDALLHNLELTFLGKKYYWVPFRKALNAFLTEKAKVSEDKLLGAFYMKKSELSNPDAIKNKLLLYLREDVLRHNAKALFEKPTFSQIAEAYDKADGGLFNAAFIEILNEANRTYTPDSTPPAAATDVEDEEAAEAEE